MTYNKKKTRRLLSLLIAGLFPLLTFSQTVALELEKINVLYIGVENPFKIAIDNYQGNNIIIKAKYGAIKQSSAKNEYIYRIDSCNIKTDFIYIGVNSDNEIKWLDTNEYRIKTVPSPQLIIAGRTEGLINKTLLVNASSIFAKLDNFEWEVKYKVLKYSYEIWRNGTIIKSESDITGNSFTKAFITETKTSQKGDKIVFYKVQVIDLGSKCTRHLESSTFEID